MDSNAMSDNDLLLMTRRSSSTSLLLLDPELDDGDVFDPPAWRPGRFLQFADISLEDEPTVRPVSLSAERAVPCQNSSDCDSVTETQGSASFMVQMDSGHLSSRQWKPSRRTTVILTSCMAVALTALTFLTFVL